MDLRPEEAKRLTVLRRHRILDTPEEATFDRITSLVARVLDVPYACVSLVDELRVWFKSAHGLAAREVPRHLGLCSSTIENDGLRHIEDATVDPSVRHDPGLPAGPIRFYVGAPLRTTDGYCIGTLCAFSHDSRKMTDVEKELMEQLASLVMHEIVFRRERGAIDPQHQGTVLVVEDDEMILTLMRRALERIGFQTLTAKTGAEADELLRSNGERVDVAILDGGFPEAELARICESLRRWSGSARTILSGPTEVRFGGASADGFLRKPFGPDELLDAVRSVVAG